MMRLSKILMAMVILSPLTAQSGVVGGSNGGGGRLQLTAEELVELNVILQEQEVVYLETELRTLKISQSTDAKLRAIDIDSLETIEIEVRK